MCEHEDQQLYTRDSLVAHLIDQHQIRSCLQHVFETKDQFLEHLGVHHGAQPDSFLLSGDSGELLLQSFEGPPSISIFEIVVKENLVSYI